VKVKPRWSVGGRNAGDRDLIEAVVQATRHRAAIAKRLRETEQMDRDAKAVGAAIRRQTRALERKTWVRCWFSPVAGKRKGSLRSRRFETMAGLTLPRPSHVASDGLSSFHFKVTSRGIGRSRRAKDRPYMHGEAVRTVRYIMRDAAREIAGGGIISNISLDPDQIAGLFAALEDLEFVTGDANGNVYISIVVSLPAELKDRETLLADICRPLADEALPYAAVLHAPDPDGDQRNYHAHVIASLRPFRHEDDGSASFAAVKSSDLNDDSYILWLRNHIAERMNAAMQREGHKRRFTAKSRADRGLSTSDPAVAKLTPGQKHSQRRADDIARAKAERTWIAEHDAARRALREQVVVIAHQPVSRRAEQLAAIAERERAITKANQAAVAHAQPTRPESSSDRKRIPQGWDVARTRRLQRAIDRFRQGTIYRDLPANDRAALEAMIQPPLALLASGQSRLHLSDDGAIDLAGNDEAVAVFRRLSALAGGQDVIAKLVAAAPSDRDGAVAWHVLREAERVSIETQQAYLDGGIGRK
jgi:hypothetical protein